MKTTCIIVLLAMSSLCARAVITFNTFAGEMRTAEGALMPVGGQVFLVASTLNGVFGEPNHAASLSVGSFLSGDDVILFRGTLTTAGIWAQGITVNLGSFANLNAGDLLQWYWFPTLTSESTSPGLGTTYGYYRDNGGIDGGMAWEIPNSDPAIITLNFATVSVGGSNPNEAGWAVSVVPEASNLIFGGLALGLVAFRFVPQLRRKLAKT